MKNNIDQCLGFSKIGGLSLVCFSLLSACSEQIPTGEKTSDTPEKPTAYIQNTENTIGVSNRVAGATESININQVLGNGYVASNTTNTINSTNTTTVTTNFTGAIGNAGGFGFNGSIGSIVGNLGGFGFGGFGTFASFFAGSLPNTPPAGILIPPGVGAPPGTGGGFGPPPGSFAPPPGGFAPPPGSLVPPVTGVPPGVGNGVGAGVGNGVGAGTGNGVGNGVVAVASTITNTNLTELQTPISNVDLDILLVTPVLSNSIGARVVALALTSTTIPCAGGGTMTQIVDDVDPVGLSTGDSRSTIYADCSRDVAGVNIVNGERGFSTEEIVGAPFITPTWVSRSTQFRNNFTRINTASGTSRMSDGSTITGISVTDNNFVNQRAFGSGTSSRTNPNNTSNVTNNTAYSFDMDFNWDVAAQSYTITFNVNVDNVGTLTTGSNVVTVSPISGILGSAPVSGQLIFHRLVDAVPTSVVIATAQADGTVMVEVDNNADGVIDISTIEADWGGVLFSIFNG